MSTPETSKKSTINPAQAIDELIADGSGLYEETVEDINCFTDEIITFVAESDQFAAMKKHKRSEYVRWIMDMRDACLAIAEYREMKELKFMEEHDHAK